MVLYSARKIMRHALVETAWTFKRAGLHAAYLFGKPGKFRTLAGKFSGKVSCILSVCNCASKKSHFKFRNYRKTFEQF